MRYEEAFPVLEKSGMGIFSFGDLRTLFPGDTDTGLVKALQRWKKRGRIAALKKGLYELTYPRDRMIPDLHVANRLYSPSYVSLETALSLYSLVPEVAQSVTSITTKPTRRFRNRHGFFVYRTLKPFLFRGYLVRKEGGFKVLVAEPEKALADYLYLKFLRRKTMDLGGERIDWKSVRKLDRPKLALYFRLFRMSMGPLNAFL